MIEQLQRKSRFRQCRMPRIKRSKLGQATRDLVIEFVFHGYQEQAVLLPVCLVSASKKALQRCYTPYLLILAICKNNPKECKSVNR